MQGERASARVAPERSQGQALALAHAQAQAHAGPREHGARPEPRRARRYVGPSAPRSACSWAVGGETRWSGPGSPGRPPSTRPLIDAPPKTRRRGEAGRAGRRRSPDMPRRAERVRRRPGWATGRRRRHRSRPADRSCPAQGDWWEARSCPGPMHRLPTGAAEGRGVSNGAGDCREPRAHAARTRGGAHTTGWRATGKGRHGARNGASEKFLRRPLVGRRGAATLLRRSGVRQRPPADRTVVREAGTLNSTAPLKR